MNTHHRTRDVDLTRSMSPQTTSEQRLGGVTGRGFLPGRSGNPQGRPAGIREYIRQKTGDGREVVDFLCDVVNGKPIKGHIPRLADRVDAARLLFERGFGRVPFADEDGDRPEVIVIELKPGQDF